MPNFMTPLPLVLVALILMGRAVLSTDQQFRRAGDGPLDALEGAANAKD
jgi:hypothetical protein